MIKQAARQDIPTASPLAGVRVLDFTSFVGGPFGGMLLADLGAEVIKVEQPPKGDPARDRQDNPGYSSTYAGINRNKRSILLDLKHPSSQPVLKRLVEQSDVLLLSVRPKSRKRLGLDYDSLKAINPALVYCSITGYGETPEARDRPAFDTTAQAMSGLMSLVVSDLDHEVKIRLFLSDLLSGVYAAHGILAALVERSRTGLGQEVRTSLLQSSLGFIAYNFHTLFSAQAANRPNKTVRPAGFLMKGSDGKAFAAHVPFSPPSMWENFVASIEMPWLKDDPRFAKQKERASNYSMLHQMIADHVRSRPADYWLSRMDEKEVACSPILPLESVFENPIVAGLGMLHGFTDPWGQQQQTVGSGVSFSRTPTVKPTRAPLLGENSAEVLALFGFDKESIEKLMKEGAVQPTPATHLPDASSEET